LKRRHFLAAPALPLLGCAPSTDNTAHITGGFTGVNFERGHVLRTAKAQSWPTPSVLRKTDVLIAGGGVAGLAAARALRLRGVDDYALLELEDSAGGNSRAGQVGGIACPLGAHYLPVPSDDAPEVQDLLEELDLRKRVAGRWQYDERHLCHSPQERLFFDGAWQPGLLPVQGVGAATLAQYQKFSTLVEQARKTARWRIPVCKWPLAQVQRALAAISFVAYLDQHGLDDAHLRWYLNYCCRDEYGAGIARVSAWAGLHYFASRHGFAAPGVDVAQSDGLLTWPEGNAWFTQRMAAPLGSRLHTGRVVLRIAHQKHYVEVDALNTATQALERWQARRVVVALPLFVAACVVANAPDFVRQAAQRTQYAPWLVANIHIQAPLRERVGAPPSWDNVLYGDGPSLGGLGYVNAMHQSLHSVPGATVLTHYRALGDTVGDRNAGRTLLMHKPWTAWRDEIVAELSTVHPDLAEKTTHINITRYGHAMAIPVPQNTNQIGTWRSSSMVKLLSKAEQVPPSFERITFAHSDWAGYSVFEEAFTLGHMAGAHAVTIQPSSSSIVGGIP
jgi:predicted NAD/FAD-dependent oxidoreductase